MGVKLGLSHCARNMGRGCSRTMRRQIFEPKRDEVTGIWKRLNDQYTPPNIIRVVHIKNEMGGACIKYGGKERCIQYIQDFGGEK